MRFRLPSHCVYWSRKGQDTFGKPTFNEAVELPCRWEASMHETVNSKGEEVLAGHRVFLETEVEVKGMLMRGRLGDLPSGFPENLWESNLHQDLREIINIQHHPNLKGTQTLYVASCL